ncbi:MAG: N-acetyltransferase [Firmicutes bacterium]|nr:N-acetyltransferase [Bacillota bacterium]
MTDQGTIRLAAPSDAAGILDIYAPFILNTAVTFELEVPTVQEMAQRIENTLARYPWVVWEVDRKVAGYAYASTYNERAAYQWSVVSSVYVDQSCRKQGGATRLYSALRDFLRLQGFHRVYAIIALPNQASERFHQGFGFEAVGTFHRAGFKLGQWHDVGWYELSIDHGGLESPVKTRTPMEVLKDASG